MKSGIYAISSRLFPEKIYIGSAQCLDLRKSRHFRELSQKCHPNHKLQHHVKKYGATDLHFHVLLFCPAKSLLFWEQQFINHFKPFFNICPTAGSRAGTTLQPGTRIKIAKRIREHHNPQPVDVLRRYV